MFKFGFVGDPQIILKVLQFTHYAAGQGLVVFKMGTW